MAIYLQSKADEESSNESRIYEVRGYLEKPRSTSHVARSAEVQLLFVQTFTFWWIQNSQRKEVNAEVKSCRRRELHKTKRLKHNGGTVILWGCFSSEVVVSLVSIH